MNFSFDDFFAPLRDEKPVKKDTSPMVRSKRIKRLIKIEEKNRPASHLFDTTVEYPSDALPEWFAGLQSVVEDETFTSLAINLGDKVYYVLSIADSVGADPLVGVVHALTEEVN